MILRLQIRSCKERLWNNIFHVVGRVFAKDVCTLLESLEMMTSVRFAIPKVAKQMKRRLNK
jgi:hypothetical protein